MICEACRRAFRRTRNDLERLPALVGPALLGR